MNNVNVTIGTPPIFFGPKKGCSEWFVVSFAVFGLVKFYLKEW